MRVALVYDEIDGYESLGAVPADFGAEFESVHTIQTLLSAIRCAGHEAAGVVFREDFADRIREAGPDLVFNIAEGVRGPARESIVPAWLDHFQIPYSGPDGLCLAITLDKAMTKSVLAGHAIRTPASCRVSALSELRDLDLTFPLIVKPNAEGSSMGIRRESLVDSRNALHRQVEWALQHYEGDCLVEEYAPGREYCVALLGNREPELLPIAEVRSDAPFRWYDVKQENRKELVCPAGIPDDLAEEMRDMGRRAFEILRCRDLARVDVRLDRDGRPTFIEINALPGLSPTSGTYPFQAKAAGLDFDGLVARLIEEAVARSRGHKKRLAV